MLVAQLSLVMLFFVATVAQTYMSRMQVIKGSTLATMCALDSETRAALGDSKDPGGISRRAADMSVRLERGGGGE